jgi:hypothetical protein
MNPEKREGRVIKADFVARNSPKKLQRSNKPGQPAPTLT